MNSLGEASAEIICSQLCLDSDVQTWLGSYEENTLCSSLCSYLTCRVCAPQNLQRTKLGNGQLFKWVEQTTGWTLLLHVSTFRGNCKLLAFGKANLAFVLLDVPKLIGSAHLFTKQRSSSLTTRAVGEKTWAEPPDLCSIGSRFQLPSGAVGTLRNFLQGPKQHQCFRFWMQSMGTFVCAQVRAAGEHSAQKVGLSYATCSRVLSLRDTPACWGKKLAMRERPTVTLCNLGFGLRIYRSWGISLAMYIYSLSAIHQLKQHSQRRLVICWYTVSPRITAGNPWMVLHPSLLAT